MIKRLAHSAQADIGMTLSDSPFTKISQSISGMIPGTSYELKFFLKHNSGLANNCYLSAWLDDVAVLRISSIDIQSATIFKAYSGTINAQQSTGSIVSIEGYCTQGGQETLELEIDDVTLTQTLQAPDRSTIVETPTTLSLSTRIKPTTSLVETSTLSRVETMTTTVDLSSTSDTLSASTQITSSSTSLELSTTLTGVVDSTSAVTTISSAISTTTTAGTTTSGLATTTTTSAPTTTSFDATTTSSAGTTTTTTTDGTTAITIHTTMTTSAVSTPSSTIATSLTETASTSSVPCPATTITFEDVPEHTATSISSNGVTFSAGGTDMLRLQGSYAGSYSTRDLHYLDNNADGSGTIIFMFSSPISAFNFLFGAPDNNWTLNAYDANNALVATLVISPMKGDNSGTPYGVSGSGIVRATLTDAQGSGDWVFVDNLGYTPQ